MKRARWKRKCGRCRHMLKIDGSSTCALGEEFVYINSADGKPGAFFPTKPGSCMKARQSLLDNQETLTFYEEFLVYLRFRWWFFKYFLLPRMPLIISTRNNSRMVMSRCRWQHHLFTEDQINRRRKRF